MSSINIYCLLILILGSFHIAMASNNLELSLNAERNEFILGEPVIVYLNVTNRDSDPFTTLPYVNPEVDIYHYYIINPDGKKISFSPLFVDDFDTSVTLKKGESVFGGARIFYGGHGYYFKIPGEYQIFVRYKNNQSNKLSIKILSPRNDSEREQAKLILDHPEVGLFLMLEGGDELSDAIKQIETMKRKYPNSQLTDYLRYAEAKNYSVPARNFVTKKPRDADLPRAIEILEEIKEKEIQMFYRSKVFKTLSTNLSKTGKQTEARKVLEDFQLILNKHKNLKPYFIDEIQQELNKLQ